MATDKFKVKQQLHVTTDFGSPGPWCAASRSCILWTRREGFPLTVGGQKLLTITERERDTTDRVSQNGVAPTTFEDQKSESKIPNINSLLIFHLLFICA